MSRTAYPRGSYTDSRPTGERAVLYSGSHIGTHLDVLPLAGEGRPNQDVLYLRITPSGPFKLAGQGQRDGLAWEWADGKWITHGPTHGVSPVIYDAAGNLLIVRPPEPGQEQTSQGYRFVDASGRVFGGDETYADKARRIWEYTTLGGVTIGQGDSGCQVLTPLRHELEPGVTTFVRVHEAGGVFAVSIVKPGEAVVHILTRAELDALPLVLDAVDPTQPDKPKDTDPPKEPTVPSFPFPDGYDAKAKIEAVRGQFPTPLGARHAEFLVKAARAVGYGAGLLRKDGGTRIALPNGVSVSQDWMVFPNGSGADFLGDGEGAATVGWGEAQANPGTLVAVDGLFVDDPGGDPGNGHEPEPQPSGELAARVKALAEQVELHAAQLVVSARREADFESRIAKMEKGGGNTGGTTLPADLADQVVVKLLKALARLGQAA